MSRIGSPSQPPELTVAFTLTKVFPPLTSRPQTPEIRAPRNLQPHHLRSLFLGSPVLRLFTPISQHFVLEAACLHAHSPPVYRSNALSRRTAAISGDGQKGATTDQLWSVVVPRIVISNHNAVDRSPPLCTCSSPPREFPWRPSIRSEWSCC